MKKKIRLLNLLLILVVFLASCNLPAEDPQSASSTAAAETVQALLTTTPQAIVTPSLTQISLPPTVTLTPQPVITNTPLATATSNCNVAQFITDVTIPDGTIMTPNQAFTKKWRIKNIGSCAWNGFTMTFDSGDAMGGPASKPLPSVNPGQEVDLELNLTAPATVGNYRGYWRIVTNGNVLVPMVNGYQGKSFYVDIKVQNPATATNTTAPAFAVTSVNFTSSGNCSGGFTATANIVANGAGTVTYYWKFSDGASTNPNSTVNFTSAGTQTVSYTWTLSGVSGTTYWIDIYIVSPNNQQFGRASITCP